MSGAPYICVRSTYYASKLWKVGETLWEGLPPNKHFTINGVLPTLSEDTLPMGPFDDPRSTEALKKDADKIPGLDTKGMDRKALWYAWAEWKKAKLRRTEGMPAAPEQELPENSSILRKNFAQWTPDDINVATAKQICDKLNKEPYSTEAKPVGTSKANLVALGIKLETEQHMNAVG